MARSKYEIRAHQELKADGWIVDYKCRPHFTPRGYNVDFFGAFDLCAYRPDVNFIRWISIKGLAGDRGKNKTEIMAVKLPDHNQKEIWWVNNVGVWRKEIIA